MIHDLIKHHPLRNQKDIVYNEVDILEQFTDKIFANFFDYNMYRE